MISVIVPTKNEEENMDELLASLTIQEKPYEIIVVDAASTDATQTIVKQHMENNDDIQLLIKAGTRGESMNYAINHAEGEAIAFIGADDRAHTNWLKHIRKALQQGCDIVSGKCVTEGKKRFELDRVKLFHKGFDISIPGTNTAFRKEILLKLGGFDTRFVTAEDIDLHFRAVEAGSEICREENAIVYRQVRDNYISFIKQSFWNGYGRKQLSLKHGRLWKRYSPQNMFRKQLTFSGLLRLFFGLLGYLTCKVTRGGIQ